MTQTCWPTSCGAMATWTIMAVVRSTLALLNQESPKRLDESDANGDGNEATRDPSRYSHSRLAQKRLLFFCAGGIPHRRFPEGTSAQLAHRGNDQCPDERAV